MIQTLFTAGRSSVLAAGLLVDLIFIQCDRMYLQGRLSALFFFDNENGYPELYQNGKEFALALLTLACVIQTGEPLYGCWFGVFSYVFLDDTFQIHERLGAWISGQFRVGSPFGLRDVDVGELAVSALAGVAVIVSLIATWRRSTAAARRVSVVLIALLFALGFFGVAMDTLHVLIIGPWQYRIGIVEDGGEMIVITIMLWFLYTIWRTNASGSRHSTAMDVDATQ